jgi:hypothetical protein
MNREQITAAVRAATPKVIARLKQKHGAKADVLSFLIIERLRQLYRQTRGRGRRWWSAVDAVRSVVEPTREGSR